MNKNLLVVTSLLTFAAPVAALPFGSSVKVSGTYIQPNQTIYTPGDVCPGDSCVPPDLVSSEFTKQHYSGHDGHDDMQYSYRYQYGSDTHGVKNLSSVPQPPYVVIKEPGHSTAHSFGYADAGATKMGAAAVADSSGAAISTRATTVSEISNSLKIGAGTSGLQDGDVVRMVLNLRLDGQVSLGATSYPSDSFAASTVWGSFKVVDTTSGWDSLAEFSTRMDAEAGDVYYPYWGHSYSASMSQSYDATSNAGTDIHYRDNDYTQGDGMSASYWEDYAYDTGLLQIAFDAIVGNEISLFGYLETWATAAGDARAYTDFSHTFGNEISATVAGLDLTYLIPRSGGEPSVSVPEPSALLLLLCGLAGLGLQRKRAA